MKKRWRWPLAGFVLGALAGATVLTVNVVGASSPAPVAVRAAGFGEILHTPVLLARAGKSVELSYDVVCGALKDEPGSHCSPSGSVFVRPVGGSTFVKLPLEREADGLLSAVVPAAACGEGVRLLRRDGQRTGSHRDAARGRGRGASARLGADRLDDDRRRRSATSGAHGRRPRSCGSSRGAAETPRSGSTAAGSSRASGHRRSTSRPTAPSFYSTR